MVERYDQDTNRFISEVIPTRDASPRPTQPQSTNVEPGNTAATYPDGWKERAVPIAKQVIGAASKIREGGSPTAVITKAVLKSSLKDALRHQEKQASMLSESVVLFHKLNDKYGPSWHDWEPETILSTAESDLHTTLSSSQLDALQAFQVVLNTNQAHENWHVFEKVGQAFNENHVDFDVVQPLRPDEVALTVKVLDSLRKEAYDPEVLGYIAACAKHYGVVFLPKEYFPEGCQNFLDEMGNDLSLKASVESKHSSQAEGSDDREKIQLAGLKEIKEYLEAKWV